MRERDINLLQYPFIHYHMQTFRLSYKRLYFLTCNREETTPSGLCSPIQMYIAAASVQMMSSSY